MNKKIAAVLASLVLAATPFAATAIKTQQANNATANAALGDWTYGKNIKILPTGKIESKKEPKSSNHYNDMKAHDPHLCYYADGGSYFLNIAKAYYTDHTKTRTDYRHCVDNEGRKDHYVKISYSPKSKSKKSSAKCGKKASASITVPFKTGISKIKVEWGITIGNFQDPEFTDSRTLKWVMNK